ncbi:MAG: glutamine synthetase family protein [Eubacterium sp.]|nr:glutamine synthetase family protein [Eubacterium sp.]
MTREDILNLIEEEDVEFIRLQFTDIFGELKNVAITARQFERVLDNNFVFDGSSLYGKKSVLEQDMYLRPELDTFVILPWRPQQGKVARFLCDIVDENGNSVDICPRNILKRTLREAEKKGYSVYVDSECEFFMFHTDDNGMPTTITHEQAGYLDVGPMDLGENARRGIVLDLEAMGFEVESSHHEKAPAQHEITFSSAEAMQSADEIITFKNAVRSTAKRFGLHATFMPKPLTGVPGSGMHVNFSVYRDDRNIFNYKDGELKDEVKYFIGGILKYAKEMCPITNPIVNSYRRLTDSFDAPKKVDWTSQSGNTLAKVRKRIGDDMKVELRFPDPSANPYLTIALFVKAGLKGVEENILPGEECSEKADRLPATLGESIEIMRNSKFVREALGDQFVDSYLDIKSAEWQEYMSQVSDWEISKYLYRT